LEPIWGRLHGTGGKEIIAHPSLIEVFIEGGENHAGSEFYLRTGCILARLSVRNA
jgi:hypothetical protein